MGIKIQQYQQQIDENDAQAKEYAMIGPLKNHVENIEFMLAEK